MDTGSSINKASRPVTTRLADPAETLLAGVATLPENKGDDVAESCVICLDIISDPCRAEPCSHANFDFICLASWVETNSTCPLCKANVSQICYKPVFGSDGHELSHSTYVVTRPAARENPTSGQLSSRHASTYQHAQAYRHSMPWANRRRRYHDSLQAAPSPDVALERRRMVYRQRLFSLHIGANRLNMHRDVTPGDFVSAPNASLRISRARMWIRRELQVFDFLIRPSQPLASSPSASQRIDNAEFLLEYIVAILKSVDIQGCNGQAEDMLTDFLGRDNTRLFLHELRNWLRSPYSTLAQWDRAVQYPRVSSGRPGRPTATQEAGQGTNKSGRRRRPQRDVTDGQQSEPPTSG